jgi:type IX secretion system PorP/SprF family membrane protein
MLDHFLNKINVKKLVALFVMYLCYITNSVAQDIHFSQYNGSVLNANPAFTGFFDGDYRVGSIYRSQWQTVPVSYSTFSAFGDTKLKTKNSKNDAIGLGLLFNNDKAGYANYSTTQFFASTSYMHKLNKDSTWLWSTGANVGISHNAFNYSKMTFDNQYNGNSYSSLNATGENFAANASNYFDISLGTLLKYIIKQRAFIQYAYSYHHINTPKITFQNNTSIKVDSKIYNYVSIQYPVSEKVDVLFELLHQHQGKYNEFIPSAMLKLHLNQINAQQIGLGFNYRAKDAIVARLFYQVKTLNVGLSYDVNTSKFMAATNRQGAFEIYVTYIFKKIVPFIPKTRVCPIYM